MSDSAINADRVFDLAGAICDEIASESDFAETDTCLLADQLSCSRYLNYCWMHVALTMEMRIHRAVQNVNHKIGMGLAISDMPAASEFGIADTEPQKFPIPVFISTAYRNTIGFFSQELPFSLLIGAVLTSLGLWFASMVYVSGPNEIAKDSSSFRSRATYDPAMEVVGKITGMVDCKWSDPQTETFNGANVLFGRKYALAAGLMEITYDTGAKVILQGPVTYEAEANGGYLSVGKLTGKLEKKVAGGRWPVARKSDDAGSTPSLTTDHWPLTTSSNPQSPVSNPLFAIRTPTAIVTDLGTVFGVQVDGAGETESHVFMGKVVLTALESNEQKQGETLVLETNQSARVTHRKNGSDTHLVVTRTAHAIGNTFVQHMPSPKENHAEELHAYGNVVLSLQPVAYYRMEQPKTNEDSLRLFDSSPGGHHGLLDYDKIGFKDVNYTHDRFGNTMYFRGGMARDHGIVSDFPKAIQDQLSISAWVMTAARVPSWAVIVSNYEGPATHGHFYFGTHPEGDLEVNIIDKNVESNGLEICLREGTERPLPIGKWQHVAFVVNAHTVRLYRNGREVAKTELGKIVFPGNIHVLGVACKTDPSGKEPDVFVPSYWYGRIAELAIFDRTLTPHEITRLGDFPPSQERGRYLPPKQSDSHK